MRSKINIYFYFKLKSIIKEFDNISNLGNYELIMYYNNLKYDKYDYRYTKQYRRHVFRYKGL